VAAANDCPASKQAIASQPASECNGDVTTLVPALCDLRGDRVLPLFKPVMPSKINHFSAGCTTLLVGRELYTLTAADEMSKRSPSNSAIYANS
jgi:hypothetical protein